MQKAIIAVIWLSALGGVGLLALTVYELKSTPVIHAQPPIDRLPPRQPHNSLARWTVTEHLSAHNVLIAQVETDYLADARAIARELTEPIKDKYLEVLIYFHRPGRPDTLPPRRVQWTPEQGYVETVYEADERN